MKKVRYFFEYIFLFLILGIARVLPAEVASNTGGWIGRTIGPRLAASRKAIKNVSLAFPNKSTQECRDIVRGMWDNLGRVIFEYPHLKTLAQNNVTLGGVELLEKYKDQPAIIFAAHLGNWEMGPISCYQQTGFITHSLYRAPNNPMVDRILKKARSPDGVLGTVPKSKSGTREMVKILQSDGHIGALIDQKYNEGVEAPFLGRPAMTSTAFIQLAKKFDCPLMPLKMERTQGAHFKIELMAPIDISNDNIEDILQECHNHLEDWIKKKPEQWLWLHRRWKD